MNSIKDLDITEINQRLAGYLNGYADHKWSVMFSPFYAMRPPKLQGSIGFDEAYEKAINQLQNAKTGSQTINPVSSFEEWEKTINLEDKIGFLRPVFELRDFVRDQFTKEEILGFYFHGSISTQDYVPYYSDFDTLVIVKKAVIQNQKWLRDFKKRLTKSNVFLYLLDPLQHHGHFVITEYDLEAYTQSLFPLELFKYTTELSSFREKVEINVISSWDNVFDTLAKRVEYFGVKWPNDIERGNFDSYEVKNAIQNILILPVLYLELKNRQYYYKKFIFEAAKQDFNSEQWSLIERATKVRENCQFHSRYPYNLRNFLGFVHPRLLHLLYRKFDYSIAKKMLAIMGENMIEEAQELTKIMIERLGLKC